MGLGKDGHVFTVAVFLLITVSSGGQTLKSYKYPVSGDLSENTVLAGINSITLNYRVHELKIVSAGDENSEYYRLLIPGHTPTYDEGKPQRPVFSKLITIPPGAGYRVKISEIATTVIDPGKEKIKAILFPAQASQVKNGDQQKQKFIFDKAVYSSQGIIPSDTVSIEYLGRSGNNELGTLNIYPVRYNPLKNQIDLIISMKIEITFSALTNSGTRSLINQSSLSDLLPDKGLLNYNPAEVVPGYSEQALKMVILTDTIFKKQLAPLLKWKTQKGFKVSVLYRGTGLAGNSTTELKDTLTKIYKSATTSDPPPEYLLIVGDINRIPTWTPSGSSGNSTDMYYGEFNGNGDYIPEMYIGRLPVADTFELSSVVKKIIQYEKFEFADTNNFYRRAMATAGNDTNFIKYMNGQVHYAVTNYLTKENNIDEFHISYPASAEVSSMDSVKKVINNGVSFINYSGHGSSDGWLFTATGTNYYLKFSDVARLTNRNMYPFVISNACRTAQFGNAASLSNRLVLADNKGAIGFIGCSNDSFWDEDYYWSIGARIPIVSPSYLEGTLGAYDHLFHSHGEPASEWYYTMGQINFAGNMSVSTSSSANKKYYWETYNLVGDPTITPIIGKPDSFRISIPDTLPNGIKSLTMSLNPFAYMAVSHFDTLWDASFASPSGTINLVLPGVSNDSCLIVITGQNKIPLIKKVYFSNIKKEFINLTSTGINDSQGNNDGRVDFGENFYLKLNLKNLGLTDANNLYAKITSGSPSLTIKNDSVWIGSLAAGSSIEINEGPDMTISGNIRDLGSATLDLILRDKLIEKHFPVDIIVHAPDVHIVSCIIDDSETGNGNHIADPGETIKLVFRVSNEGSSNISGLFNVISNDEGVKVTGNDIKSGLLQFGDTTDISIEVKISETMQSGNFFSVVSTLDCFPFTDSRNFLFRVGRVRETFESMSFKIFPWINLSQIPWTLTSSESFDGNVSARSGLISHNDKSSLVLKTVYPAADSISFYYKVSCEQNYDFFSFLINDTEVLKNSGEVGWTKAAFPVKAGINKFNWVYRKDNSVSAGSDCAWVDMIDFSQTGSLKYIQKDLQMVAIASPGRADYYGDEIVTVRLLNGGRDTINGFNLAYVINDDLPVFQSFDDKLFPSGDTATVAFRTRANMSKYGFYKITAYALRNNDDYPLNDTAFVTIENTDISNSYTLYPNPFRDEFSLYLNSRGSEKLEISLINIRGEIVYRTDRVVYSGKNEIKFSNLKLSPALYYLNIRGATINKTMTVMKANR